jgi:hypothetical protein
MSGSSWSSSLSMVTGSRTLRVVGRPFVGPAASVGFERDRNGGNYDISNPVAEV